VTHPFFDGARRPRVLAHRGLATADATWENSAGAFAAAVQAGAEYVETDCRMTADGDVVLFHDEQVERLTGDPRPISGIHTSELRQMFAGHGDLLTLAEALETFPDTRFNVDVKVDAAAELAGQIVAPHAHRVLLTSFSDARRRRAMDAARGAGARLPPATSGGRNSIAALRLLSSLRLPTDGVLRDLDAVQIPVRQGPIRVLTPALLRAAHDHDVEVHVWTVNDADEMTALVASGVDGIVTDRADLALQTLNR
jgi:glycerophosphoryl diester phosphodiesterase